MAERRLSARRQRGLTLVEVLVAFLVLSLGLIGIAALHMTAVQGSHSSLQRSLASVAALDLEEWLWQALADPDLAGCPDFDGVIADLLTRWQEDQPVAPAGRGATWPQAEFFQLPGLDMELEETTVAADGSWIEGRVVISWDEARFLLDDERESFAYTARVACR